MTMTDRYSALLKIAASYGDYVNAGLGAMTMGSPSTPRYFKPGTNEISDDLPRQQKNTVVGNGIGLGVAALPSVAGGALTAARAAPAALGEATDFLGLMGFLGRCGADYMIRYHAPEIGQAAATGLAGACLYAYLKDSKGKSHGNAVEVQKQNTVNGTLLGDTLNSLSNKVLPNP